MTTLSPTALASAHQQFESALPALRKNFRHQPWYISYYS